MTSQDKKKYLPQLVHLLSEGIFYQGKGPRLPAEISWLAWECLVVPVNELEEVAGDGKIWVSLLTVASVSCVPDMHQKVDG